MSDFVIINGFDRSGSSSISRTLAAHPDIELIMQPFNSGFVRKKMYKIIDVLETNGELLVEEHQFFKCLEKNILNNNLINSQWHYKYSTTQTFVPGKLHIIKTTLNHFYQRWMKINYPSIDVWGIWREPLDIVSSIMRNGFYGKWYEEALDEIKPAVKSQIDLRDNYLNFFNSELNEPQKVALLIAVRTHFFLNYLDRENIIVYDEFRKNANVALKNFIGRYNLKKHDFLEVSNKDLNIIGKAYNKNDQVVEGLSVYDRDKLELIFQPLRDLYKSKFE